MKPFINSLAAFKDEDFPVPEVSSLIQNSQFSKETIKKYSYFSKYCYTRNKIYKDNIVASGRVIYDSGIACFWSNKTIQINKHDEIPTFV